MLHHALPYVLPLVRFAVIADDQHRLRHDGLQVRLQGFPFLDGLRLAYDDHFSSTHHGVTACGTDDRSDIGALQVTTIHYLLVKLTRHVIQRVRRNELIHLIRVIRFVSAQDINRSVRTRAQGGHDVIVLPGHRYKSCNDIWSGQSHDSPLRVACSPTHFACFCTSFWF